MRPSRAGGRRPHGASPAMKSRKENLRTSTPEQKFDDVFSSGDGEFVGRRGDPASHEPVQISACELRVKGPGDLLIMFLEAEDTGSDGVLGREVGRNERFALEDGEVDLDLIQPRCM